ncbi:MAG: transposase [Acidimicrobiales bacterium]
MISIPVNLRLHRKDGPTKLSLAAEMISELCSWFPSTRFVLCGNGAHVTLAGNHLARTAVVSRMRRDPALYEAPPSRTNRRGRPRKKGARLDTPVQLAKAATSYQVVELDWRGDKVTKLLSRVASYGTGSTRKLWCASSSS